MKRVVAAVLVLSVLSSGNLGCMEKAPPQNELKVTTPGGTTVTIEKPVKNAGETSSPVRH